MRRFWLRPRFYVKLFAFIFAAGFTGFTLWFVLRVEKIILSNLPREITAQNLSVSFLGRSFILSGVKLTGLVGSQCEGRLLAELKEVTGTFTIRTRRLTGLTVNGADLYNQVWEKACFATGEVRREFRLSEAMLPEGLSVVLKSVSLRLPQFGEATVNAKLKLEEPAEGSLRLTASAANLTNIRLSWSAKRLAADFRRAQSVWQLAAADVTLAGTVKQLEKIQKLSSRRLTILGGNADIRMTASARRGRWTIFTSVELSRVRLRGEPFYTMPMGLMQLTPENMWPMVEDSPGIFAFSFKTEAAQAALPAVYAADVRRALTRKVKGNLKKKVPILPF